jgi:hypothetical protein
MFNNTNEIQTESPTALANTMQQYITHNPTVLGLIETRCNWQLADRTSIPLCSMATSLQGNGKAKTKLATANYGEAHTANDICQPGGVTQLTINKIFNLIKHSGSDSLGIWVWQEYRVNGTYSLYIITAYRVCPKPTAPNTKMTTTWHQQDRGLREQGILDDPRDQFLTDLKDFLLDLHSDGHKYIVGWDANDPHDHNDVMELLEETEMIDAFIDFFPERPPTHQWGALQIDLISVSASLLEFIEFAFILDPSASEK